MALWVVRDTKWECVRCVDGRRTRDEVSRGSSRSRGSKVVRVVRISKVFKAVRFVSVCSRFHHRRLQIGA